MKIQHIEKIFKVVSAFALILCCFCMAPYAYAAESAHGTTNLALRAIDNPFQVGENQEFAINEGDDALLTGDIEGGIGNVGYQWSVSSDGGKTWTDIVNATDKFYQIINAEPGNYIYRLTAMDQYGNSNYQDFTIHVDTLPISNVDNHNESSISDVLSHFIPKTGDNILMLCALCIAVLAALIVVFFIAVHKRMNLQESDGDFDE